MTGTAQLSGVKKQLSGADVHRSDSSNFNNNADESTRVTEGSSQDLAEGATGTLVFIRNGKVVTDRLDRDGIPVDNRVYREQE